METPIVSFEEIRRLNREARKQTIGYIMAAFGLVAGLAWNEAIQGAIAYWLPLGKDSISAKFIYAIVITILLVLITQYLARIFVEPVEQK